MASAKRENVRIVQGKENLSLYQWNTKMAEHYFCKTCGIYTHHRRRSNPDECGFNVACIEGVDSYDLGEVSVGNGAAMSLLANPSTT